MADKVTQRDILDLIEELLKVPAGSITADTQIGDVEEWDSLMHVMIIGELESRLGVVIPLEDAVEVTCVRELLERAGCL